MRTIKSNRLYPIASHDLSPHLRAHCKRVSVCVCVFECAPAARPLDEQASGQSLRFYATKPMGFAATSVLVCVYNNIERRHGAWIRRKRASKSEIVAVAYRVLLKIYTTFNVCKALKLG